MPVPLAIDGATAAPLWLVERPSSLGFLPEPKETFHFEAFQPLPKFDLFALPERFCLQWVESRR